MARTNSGASLVSNAQLTVDARQIKRVSADNGTAGVAGWVMLFDSAVQPTNGAVPDCELPIAATPANVVFDFKEMGERFVKGLWVCLSTTPASLTLGAATCRFEAEYY